MIDSAIFAAKGKPGPTSYQNAAKGKDLIMDRTGSYKGLCKSNVEQLLMMNDAKIKIEGRPRPGHYNPTYVSHLFFHIFLLFYVNLDPY